MTPEDHQFRLAVDALPASVALLDTHLKFTFVNKQLATALRLPAEQVVGRTCLELGMQVKDWGDWNAEIHRVVTSKQPSRLDFISTCFGREQLLRVKFAPLFNAAGDVDQVIALALADSTRQDLEETLANKEQRFNAFMDALPLVAWLRDEEERYVYLNPAYQKAMLVDPKEWYGKHVREKWPAETAEKFLANDQKLLESGKPIQVEESGETPTGEWKIWYNVKFTYRDMTDRLYYGGVGMDITNLKKEEQAKHQFEKQMLQAQKFESLGVLAGGVAHDFNNILTSILGFATLSKMQTGLPADNPLHQNLSQIEQAALRAAELCQQMLAFSGRGQLLVRAENVNTIIEQMTPLLTTAIRKQIVLKTYLSKQVPLIQCDASQVRQVLMNLVTNASDAIGDRSGVISIITGVIDADEKYLEDLHVTEQLKPGQYSYIEVSDTGSGMHDDVKSRIFEPFFTTKFVGRGLGLSAVQGIMRGHLGCVKVYTQLNKGSTFKVLFPVRENGEVQPGRSSVEVQVPTSYGNGRSVLVADDEEDVRVFARKLLENLGFIVNVAKDGREAVELFRADPARYDLVIMDLTMPRLSGQEAFRELRQLRPNVKVILTSGYNEAEATSGFEGKGLSGFLCKPFRVQALIKLIKELIG